ncbi:hypothetical protein ACHQM5_011610 [Ranunculus cassubicifolius]
MSSLGLDYSWKLPEEITSQILSRLPVKSVLRCRCVCKAWRSFLKDLHFVGMHLGRAYEEKERSLVVATIDLRSDDDDRRDGVPVIHMSYNVHLVENMFELGRGEQLFVRIEVPSTVWASCNGLLCSCSLDSKDLKICNPFTKETVELPKSKIRTSNKICGFGYHPVTKEYKVLCFPIVSSPKNSVKIFAEVHTLGSNSWRSKGEIPFTIYWRPFNVLVNGALHWLVQYPKDSGNVMITAFDIGDEEFRFLPVPPELLANDKWAHRQVQEFGEFLSLVDFSPPYRVEIWVMKQYGVEESWVKQFVVPITVLVKSVTLIWPLEGGEVLLHYNQKFVSYDPMRNQTTPLAVQSPPNINHAYVHVGSLVSPHMTMRQSAELEYSKSRAG